MLHGKVQHSLTGERRGSSPVHRLGEGADKVPMLIYLCFRIVPEGFFLMHESAI